MAKVFPGQFSVDELSPEQLEFLEHEIEALEAEAEIRSFRNERMSPERLRYLTYLATDDLFEADAAAAHFTLTLMREDDANRPKP